MARQLGGDLIRFGQTMTQGRDIDIQDKGISHRASTAKVNKEWDTDAKTRQGHG